jgi:hypothetical protein
LGERGRWERGRPGAREVGGGNGGEKGDIEGIETYRTVLACSSIGAPEIKPAGSRFSSLPFWTFFGTGVKVL